LREADHATHRSDPQAGEAAFERESHLKLHISPIHIRFESGALTVAGEVPDVASKRRLIQLTRAYSAGEPIIDQLRVSADRGASLTVLGGRIFSHVNAPPSKSNTKRWQIVERVYVLG